VEHVGADKGPTAAPDVFPVFCSEIMVQKVERTRVDRKLYKLSPKLQSGGYRPGHHQTDFERFTAIGCRWHAGPPLGYWAILEKKNVLPDVHVQNNAMESAGVVDALFAGNGETIQKLKQQSKPDPASFILILWRLHNSIANIVK
jgi:hypothetical protein